MTNNNKGIVRKKKEISTYKLRYYHGSLDFPCDFCGKNAYKNYHIGKDDLVVVCEDCLKKAKEKEEEEKE